MAAATLAAFTSLLDVTVTNASLPQIQGAIGASGTEGTWIGTAYIAAEVVMIPLTAWLGRLLGLRLYLLIAIAVFVAFSFVCGLASTLPQMIVGRVGQGFAGGALIPAGLTIIATRLTPAQRNKGIAVYATMTVLAPVLGPVVGGWFTETISWHWIFFMNLPLGMLLAAMTMWGLDREPVRGEEFWKADWLGIAGLAIGLASLIVVLEEGQRENWFDSREIVLLSLSAAAGFALIGWSQFRTANPVLKFRLLRDRQYAAASICVFAIGGAPYAAVYLVATFLGLIAGYDAQQTGIVSVYAGITSFLMMPLFVWMLPRFDVRLMIGTGIMMFGVAALIDTGITVESVGASFLLSQLIRGGAQMLGTLPLSQIATAGLRPEDAADGAALFTVARNLGGSVVLALCGVVLDRRLHLHTEQLGAGLTANNVLAQDRVGAIAAQLMTEGADAAHAQLQAMRLVAGEVQRQALTMAYIDAFWLLGIGLLIVLPAVYFVRPRLGRIDPGAAH